MISIGGDVYGSLTHFLCYQGNIDRGLASNPCGQNVFQAPNPFLSGLNSIILALSTSPENYVNNWFYAAVLIPFVLVFFILKSCDMHDRRLRLVLTLIGAVTIAFSSFNIWQTLAGHYGFNLVFLLVWLWTHFRLCCRPALPIALLSGIALGVNAVFSPYFGFFSGLLAVFSVVVLALRQRQRAVSLIRWNALAWVVGISVVAIVVFPVFDALIHALQQPVGVGFIRDPAGVWGVLPWMYLLPPPSHLLASESYQEFYRQAMIIGNVPENAVYLGIFNIVFFFYGAYLYFVGKLTGSVREVFFLSAIFALFCLLLSLPPFVPLPGGERLYLAGHYLHSIFPMFRIYSRLGILVLFFATVGAIIAFRYFLDAHPKHAGRLAVGALLLVAVDLFPRLPTLDVAQHPKVYDWLKAQPGQFSIYELPEDRSLSGKDDFQFYKRVYYQAIHGKGVVNRTIQKGDIHSRDFYEALRARGVRYLVQHESMYEEGPLPHEYKPYVPRKVAEERFNNGIVEKLPSWYVLVARVGSTVVYQLE